MPTGPGSGEGRFHSGKWDEVEERRFSAALTKFGSDWVQVSKVVETRSNIQCKSHYSTFKRRAAKPFKKASHRTKSPAPRHRSGQNNRSKSTKPSTMREVSSSSSSSSSSNSDYLNEDEQETERLLRASDNNVRDVELGALRRKVKKPKLRSHGKRSDKPKDTVFKRSRSRSRASKQSRRHRSQGKNNASKKGEDSAEMDLAGDYGNIALLLLLYTLQGIPMGLTQAVRLSLASQKDVSMDAQGMFSLVSWPFSVKLLWAPIVDSLFVARFGRRKTWLVPTQVLISTVLIATSPFIGLWMTGNSEAGIAPDVFKLTAVFFVLFFLCATQDICVDGWALTLLSKRNVGYASTCNAIGQTLGNLLSYVGWIGCEKFDIMTFGTFSAIWGFIFLFTTVLVAFSVKERDVSEEDQPPTVVGAYKEMALVLQNPLVKEFLVVLLTCKVAFASDEMAQIMLVGPVGMPKEHFVMIGLFLTIPSLLVPKLVDRYTTGPRPFNLFVLCTPVRLLLICCAALLYYYAPTPFDTHNYTWYTGLGLLSLTYTVISQAMFVAMMAFFTQISDPRIGGTYMTMLNTAGNLASKWPSTIFLFGVARVDEILASTPEEASNHPGFYPCTIISVGFGLVWMWFASQRLERMQSEDLSKWRANI